MHGAAAEDQIVPADIGGIGGLMRQLGEPADAPESPLASTTLLTTVRVFVPGTAANTMMPLTVSLPLVAVAAGMAALAESSPPGWSRRLLVRRSPTRIGKGEHELAYHLCAAPAGTTDEDLIRVAGSRWAIEECFQTANTETGLDQYQVRRYDAWYRHITLAMLARLPVGHGGDRPKALAAASSQSRSA